MLRSVDSAWDEGGACVAALFVPSRVPKRVSWERSVEPVPPFLCTTFTVDPDCRVSEI